MDQLLAMRSFVRVANILSFQEAAKLEGLSQGTISKRVSALEKHMGIQLLRRNQRAVRLTNFGESYLAKCEQLLAQLVIATDRRKWRSHLRWSNQAVGRPAANLSR